jgi:GDP-4-dehydro-6-deoxy-D-mannose reductase
VGEDHPLRPGNPYAVSKAAVDMLTSLYRDAHGLRVTSTRAFNHAGPGQSDDYVVSAFARQIAEGEARGGERIEIVTGSLEPRRDFTDVRDVVRAYWLALERAEPGVYNVGSGGATAIADILAGLAAHSRLAVEQRTDPAKLRPHEVMEIRASHDKLTQATGWRPEIPLETTLRDTLDWWRERVAAGVSS